MTTPPQEKTTTMMLASRCGVVNARATTTTKGGGRKSRPRGRRRRWVVAMWPFRRAGGDTPRRDEAFDALQNRSRITLNEEEEEEEEEEARIRAASAASTKEARKRCKIKAVSEPPSGRQSSSSDLTPAFISPSQFTERQFVHHADEKIWPVNDRRMERTSRGLQRTNRGKARIFWSKRWKEKAWNACSRIPVARRWRFTKH